MKPLSPNATPIIRPLSPRATPLIKPLAVRATPYQSGHSHLMSPLLLSHSHQRPPSYQTRFQIHQDCRATPLIGPDFRFIEIEGPPLLSGQISDALR
jgi:hypothetical protein